MVIDSRSTKQRLSDFTSELLDDFANASEAEELTAKELADLFWKEVDEWMGYYRKRYEFYLEFKDAIKQRVC